MPIDDWLNLHWRITEQMRRHADVIVCFKKHPHDNQVERIDEVWRVVDDTTAADT